MKRLLILMACLIGGIRPAVGLEGRRPDSVLLNGVWQSALGDGSESPYLTETASALRWNPVSLPGRLLEGGQDRAAEIKFVWVRRMFDVSQAQASRLAVLCWDRIVHGATAYVNGRQVGYNEPTGPYQVILPPGLLKAGKNEIVLKIAGGAGVRKSKSGHFLFPAGQIWGPSRPELPAVAQDVWVDFADRAYVKWALAIPDLAHQKVRIRVTLTGLEPIEDLEITARVRIWPDGPVVGAGTTRARLVPNRDPLGGEHFWVEVPMPGFKPWTPEECNLYEAEISPAQGGDALDVAKIRFGMREINVVGGHYQLNGKTLRLRGSNLVHEWDWADVIRGKEKDYLVTEAREMNINAFRTHTQPPPRLWADLCDEHGTMILAEFPVLYNYRDHRYTAEEWEIFHRNALADAAGWMARLWNHPSVVMWVLSNESRSDNEWETGPFQDFVGKLDPTRPTMRTGSTGTRTNYDVHTCGNTNHWTREGQMQTVIDQWFHAAAGRPVTNSEYMNIFERPLCQWTGSQDEEADRLAYAQLGMEHTEAMRRARVDGMLPYMYAGWTRTRRGEVWKAGFAQPVSAAWHSALSPVLASLDLFNANYLVGQEVTTRLFLINDSWHDVGIHVDLLLTQECPEFIPEADCFQRPLARWRFDFQIKADSVRTTDVAWKLPETEGSYWLTARTTGVPGRAVLSQRFVRAVRPPVLPPAARKRTFIVLGGDATSEAWFRARHLAASAMVDPLLPDEHMVVLWNPGKLTDQERRYADRLCRFAAGGGRIVILSTEHWDWKELCDLRVTPTGGSRVFPYDGTNRGLLEGVNSECLKRWNGLPGTVAAASIEGAAVDAGRKHLWVREPKNTVVAEVPARSGGGRLVFSQLDLRSHVIVDSEGYDPVAEQILLHLLQ